MTIIECILIVYISLFIIKYALLFRVLNRYSVIIGNDAPNVATYLYMFVFGGIYVFVFLLYLLFTEGKEFFCDYSDEFIEEIRNAAIKHRKNRDE
ncbi:MAG: hypothetical protein HQL80_12495 [Magnetococcales bacterium]|nr:hypothetical protein [Magnetococcales bacterium]